MADASALREKEASAYEKKSSEDSANIAATAKATAAVEQGMSSFVQTPTAKIVLRLARDRQQEDLVSFLSGSSEYSPASGEIVGILKTMHDEMSADAASDTAAEQAAIKAYDALMASKTKEVNALTKAIEEKMTRSGELAVQIVQMKNDLGDTAEALVEDKKFLADMQKNCATKTAEWEVIVKTRNEELLALADTIKVLNDDDTLELMKKTLPSGAASLMQVQVSEAGMRQRALSMLRAARNKGGTMSETHFDFLELALTGKKVSFDKIIKMIDELVAQLGKEQFDDDAKKQYCDAQLDIADDKKKASDHKISDFETEIEDLQETIATLKSEIDALGDGIRALDKQVAEATEQRKEEHADYLDELAGKSAATDILAFAMNRLNKFYNPKLYKPPPKRELTEAERITVNNGGTLAPTEAPGGIGGTGITVLAQEAPAPPPEVDLTYKKSSGGNNAITEMMNMLMSDLEKQITEMKVNEKDAQQDYESFVADSADKRAEDSKSITDKEGSLAELESELLANQEALKAKKYELMDVEKYIMELHKECDWIMKNYDLRKSARAGEVDSLKNAKAALSGADFGL